MIGPLELKSGQRSCILGVTGSRSNLLSENSSPTNLREVRHTDISMEYQYTVVNMGVIIISLVQKLHCSQQRMTINRESWIRNPRQGSWRVCHNSPFWITQLFTNVCVVMHICSAVMLDKPVCLHNITFMHIYCILYGHVALIAPMSYLLSNRQDQNQKWFLKSTKHFLIIFQRNNLWVQQCKGQLSLVLKK